MSIRIMFQSMNRIIIGGYVKYLQLTFRMHEILINFGYCVSQEGGIVHLYRKL